LTVAIRGEATREVDNLRDAQRKEIEILRSELHEEHSRETTRLRQELVDSRHSAFQLQQQLSNAKDVERKLAGELALGRAQVSAASAPTQALTDALHSIDNRLNKLFNIAKVGMLYSFITYII
jgi:chromosome segregation ATPase